MFESEAGGEKEAGLDLILSGGVFDTERGARIVLDEYRAGKIAAVALENPTDNFEPQQAEQTDINNEKD